MIHAFLASIGWHAGTLVIRALGSLVLLSLPVLAIRAGIRRLRRHPGGDR